MLSSRIKAAIKVFIFIVLVMIIQHAFSFALVPANVYVRLMMHGMYKQDSIDVVFLGASHTYRSFVPSIFDEALGMNTYNVGSSSQSMKDSYYVLKEVLRYHNPKQVVLEPGYTRFVRDDGNAMKSMILTDHFNWSLNRVEYFFDAYKPEEYINALFPTVRYKDNFKLKSMKEHISKKMSEGYIHYSDDSIQYTHEWYGGKGFVFSEKAFHPGNIGELKIVEWNQDAIDSEKVLYFEKITQLCKDNDIELILMTAPVPLASLVQMKNYDDVYCYIQSLANKYGVEYYDFNLVRPEILERKDEDFYDEGHMNGPFAEKFSAVAGQLIKIHNSGSVNRGDYLYPSFDELSKELTAVTHVWMSATKKADKLLLSAHAGHGKNITPEYCFLYRKEGDEDFSVLQEFSTISETLFLPEEGENYVFRVLVRNPQANTPYEQYEEILYD